MRHGISVPSLGEHQDRHDASDRTAKLSGLADSVHDLAEQFLIGNVFAGMRVAGALNNFAAKSLNFVGSHPTEILVERIARFELLAIDQQSVGTWQRIASSFVEIPEQFEAAVLQRRGVVSVFAVKAGDKVVNELRDRGVLADDDETRGHVDTLLLPQLECLLIVAVESLQRCLQSRRKLKRVEFLAFAAPSRRHVLANVLPEVTEHRHLVAGDVFRYGHARELDDATLNGIHQREVAHRPGEQCAFGVTRAAKKKGRRGQVYDAAYVELSLHGFET